MNDPDAKEEQAPVAALKIELLTGNLIKKFKGVAPNDSRFP